MPRSDADPTKATLFPDWPFSVPAERVPTLKGWWDRQVDKRSQDSPRLFNKKLEAVILRRLQESIAKKRGLPE